MMLQETVIRPTQPTFGAVPPFAPRPQPSALSATPILNQPIDAEEPEVIRFVFSSPLPVKEGLTTAFNRKWRERQAEEIGERDERSKTRRQETISRAERAIDQFYEEYNSKREKQISENKYASHAIISLRSFLD
jgi:Clathrin light chain